MVTTHRFVRLDENGVGNAANGGLGRARANFARALGALAAFLLYCVVATPAHAAPGDLDATFGSGGKVTTDFGSADAGFGVAVQADGKIVAAGASGAGGASNFVLSRYNADGSLDSSFGTGGKVTTSFPSGAGAAFAIAIQADGKIVAVGGILDGTFDFALARYNADGSLDSTFGSGGLVTTDFSKREQAMGVAIQADGKIVAAGFACSPFANDAGDCDIALARYNADGSLDGSFGSGGKVMTGPDRLAAAVAIQSDGKIVTAGITFIGGSSDFLVARFNTDGSLDSTFGSGGLVTTDFAGGDQATSVEIQADGKIVAVGEAGTGDFALARYNADGTLDSSFGAAGKVTTDFGGSDMASGVVIQPDGKIVAAGSTFSGLHDFALARYDANGSLDSSFGSGGKVTTDFTSTSDIARAVAIQTDGKIVAAGIAGSDFALARYLVGITVAIDIKPGSFPNSINLGSAGVVPVAILSSATFDATQVDPATVTLAGATVRLIGKANKYSCSPQDVNSDGLTDLVCHVETAQFAIQLGDSVAVLEAKTFSGQRIRGEDIIRIVP